MNKKYPLNLCRSQGGIIHRGKRGKRRGREKRRAHTLGHWVVKEKKNWIN